MKKFAFGCGGILLVLVFVAVVVAIAVAGKYNALVKLDQSVNQSWAQVQNVYQRRADLIPNLVQTVTGAANFEKSTLIAVTNARASVGQVKLDPNKAPTDAAQLEQFQAAQGQLSNALSRLLVVSENYPQLRANENFQQLQAQLEGTENRISVERGNFNRRCRPTTRRCAPSRRSFSRGCSVSIPGRSSMPSPGAEKAPEVKFDFGNAHAPAAATAAPTPNLPSSTGTVVLKSRGAAFGLPEYEGRVTLRFRSPFPWG